MNGDDKKSRLDNGVIFTVNDSFVAYFLHCVEHFFVRSSLTAGFSI